MSLSRVNRPDSITVAKSAFREFVVEPGRPGPEDSLCIQWGPKGSEVVKANQSFYGDEEDIEYFFTGTIMSSWTEYTAPKDGQPGLVKIKTTLSPVVIYVLDLMPDNPGILHVHWPD